MKKKIVLTAMILVLGCSFVWSMSSDKSTVTDQIPKKAAEHSDKLVDMYSKADLSSAVSGEITLQDQNDYNIFFCKEIGGWCEVVNRKDGSVGWISLDQLRQAQEKYSKNMYKKNALKNLIEHTKLQDQKIVQLQTMMMQMQKELVYALQNQQVQINQLKQASYYY